MFKNCIKTILNWDFSLFWWVKRQKSIFCQRENKSLRGHFFIGTISFMEHSQTSNYLFGLTFCPTFGFLSHCGVLKIVSRANLYSPDQTQETLQQTLQTLNRPKWEDKLILFKLGGKVKNLYTTTQYCPKILNINLPDLATSATSTPCSLAMNPKKEKMTVPAYMEVQELTQQIMRASL